ncbi:hypothetical protein [Dehalococcoides mccartyi]|jgi:high-affinity Fe2+/Pb2+ permease|uniref:DUF4405 domain-containing protein n=2 Tax=Dehalococcoides mccartyi TaxID=61435 RepID=A0A142VC11_9CHLR|nr:hypothetical protein [Dehalococcoides mccartyi]AMU87348.1 hypothetical protein Dm11a5_1522 [Dehalococcoides mccartyi]AOV99993.1 hypothetical protein DCWBC2_1386 [Dehalococcoides mccartyi]MBA2084332.1 hypothetical protein [Dehalococcoides mccartyi]BCT56559.1 hypothetical protein DHCNIT_00013220 [Dehalococcoides mccartyi]
MRRAVCISMAVLFLATIITGIAEAHVHPGHSGHHVAVAIAFIASILIHVGLNRKSFARYLSG